jgi:hypothetical protein|tara:strand:- start:259 stop:909 length:651 start_codon:yes stop_codon:yes gene_type:complete
MAITHSDFLTQVRNYTEVDSNVLTDSIIDGFIRATELNVAGQVDYDDLRKYSTSTFTSGNRYVSLPADCMIIRSIQVINGSDRTFLERRDTSFISEYNSGGTTGEPKFWANWDDFNVLVAPTPNSAYTIQINFIKDPPHFNSSTNTFLSTYQEPMLLHGVLTEAFSYLKGPQDLYTLYKSKYDEEIQNFALQQMGRRRRGEYDSGVPRVKIPSPSP